MKKHKNTFSLFLTGFFMGSADIVPGVSGGTIAFIMGIYQKLIETIRFLSGDFLRMIFKGKFKKAFTSIPFDFIIPLGAGLVIAILSLAKLVSFLLNVYPEYIWSFFFGLIIASVLIISRKIKVWSFRKIIIFILSAFCAFWIVGLVPVTTPHTLPMIFLSGSLAICAMILPGISGSLLLVVMGKYEQILDAVINRDIVVIGVFMVGAMIGLSLFSRLLTWTLKKYYNMTLVALMGFMVGSLRKVWPWKEIISYRINSKGLQVPISEINIFPNFNISFVYTLIFFTLGILFILYLSRIQSYKEKVIEDKIK
jgi:putative membrane protein